MRLNLRKPKSLWEWTAATIAAGILLVLAINEVAILLTTRRLDARLAALRADGKPTTFAELLGPPIPEERNAAVPLARAAERAEAIYWAYIGAFGAKALADEADVKGTTALAAAADSDPSYEADLESADAIPIYRCIDELTGPIPTATYAAGGAWQHVWRVEWVRSRRKRHEGRPIEAADLVLRLYRLSRKRMKNEPFLVSESFSRNAQDAALAEWNRILQNHSLPDRIHAEIETQLADEEGVRNDQIRAFESHRALDLHMHEAGRLQFMNGRFLRAWANVDKLRSLDFTDRMIEVVHGPSSAVMGLDRETTPFAAPTASTYARMVFPGTVASLVPLSWHRRAFDWQLARTRCLRMINAARRHRLGNPTIEALGLPKSATTDPFNGAPLRLAVRPDGLLVYSVGDDLTDDGGAITKAGKVGDVGFGPEPGKGPIDSGKR